MRRATKEVDRKNGEDTENLRYRARIYTYTHTPSAVRAANNGRMEAFGGKAMCAGPRTPMSYTVHKCKRNLLSLKVAKRVADFLRTSFAVVKRDEAGNERTGRFVAFRRHVKARARSQEGCV